MTKYATMTLLICAIAFIIAASEASASDNGESEWRMYSQEPNGDVYFYDASRVESDANQHKVWSRIRYKTSVMGASSYQSLLEVNCLDRTEQILQNTFFSDRDWGKPAMATDRTAKPKRQFENGSAIGRLSEILCDQ